MSSYEMASYSELIAEHAKLVPFSGLVPQSTLQPLAFLCLTVAFLLTFYFSTLKSAGVKQELLVGGTASIVGGFGLVFAFCAVGVNV